LLTLRFYRWFLIFWKLFLAALD